MKEYLLGIDIGTSACKVTLFSADGGVIAQTSADYQVYYKENGWAEQNPDEWWEAVCLATREVIQKSDISPAAIKGVGVDGQSWSAIPITKTGEVLANTPIWFDTRAQNICDEYNEKLDRDWLFSISGNTLQPTYSLPKILWFQRNMPIVYEKAYQFLQSNSFIVYRLTGAFSQDMSQGYGLQCFDVHLGKWNDNACRQFGIDKEKLPTISACHHIVGTITKQAAELSGLSEGTPVVAGGLDAACGTLGVGVIQDGETQEQGGQAGGMSICMSHSQADADPHLILSHHVVPNRWLLQGGTVGGGGVLRWFEQEFGESERQTALLNGTKSLEEMDKLAESIAVGSDGLLFLPYMAGERSPIWNTKAKGVYYGIDYGKTRGHFIRASMEGVAFALKHNLDVAEKAGAVIGELRAMGGAANSRVWTQMKADVTGKNIVVPSSDVATALGAAILAGVGTGVYTSFEEAVEQTVSVKKEYFPNADNTRQYEEVYKLYLQLYESLMPMMNEGGAK